MTSPKSTPRAAAAEVSPVCTPLVLFRDLASLAAVSSAEGRTYTWVLDHYARVRPPRLLSNRLSAAFVGGSQLMVNWTGDPLSNRRTVLVVHTDCEGYVLGRGRLSAGDPVMALLEGRFEGGGELELFRQGANVLVVVGQGGDLRRVPGVVDRVNSDLDGQPAKGKVVISVAAANLAFLAAEVGPMSATSNAASLVAEVNRPGTTATAIHVFRHGRDDDESQYRDPVVVFPSGDVFAPFVDNAAGVAVATAVLDDLVHHGNERLNVSVLYTTGEETGFTGILRHLLENPAGTNDPDEELLWLVIDGSDVFKSIPLGLSAWQSVRRQGQRPPSRDNPERCRRTCASVRLGDKGTDYDPDVARMLVQAALEVRRELDVAYAPTNPDASFDDLDPVAQLRGTKGKDWRWLGSAGVFGGGWCEAAVLTHLPDLVRQPGRDGGPLRALVGSLAIPIQNYRQVYGDPAAAGGTPMPDLGSNDFAPEKTHVSAVNSAFLIARAACNLHMTYFYPRADSASPNSGYRPWLWTDRANEVAKANRQALVDMWLSRGRGASIGDNAAVVEWVRTKGIRHLSAKLGS